MKKKLIDWLLLTVVFALGAGIALFGDAALAKPKPATVNSFYQQDVTQIVVEQGQLEDALVDFWRQGYTHVTVVRLDNDMNVIPHEYGIVATKQSQTQSR